MPQGRRFHGRGFNNLSFPYKLLFFLGPNLKRVAEPTQI